MLDPTTANQVKEIIFQFLSPKEYKVFIFGSRALDTGRKFSDIDIGIESKKEVPDRVLSDIQEAFEESDIPFTVDVVDFSNLSERFKKVAQQKVIYL